MSMYVNNIPLSKGKLWKFPKFHKLLHILDNMERFRASLNNCAQHPESLLIPVAKKLGNGCKINTMDLLTNFNRPRSAYFFPHDQCSLHTHTGHVASQSVKTNTSPSLWHNQRMLHRQVNVCHTNMWLCNWPPLVLANTNQNIIEVHSW